MQRQLESVGQQFAQHEHKRGVVIHRSVGPAVDLESIGAEGTEVSVPARGSVRPIIQDVFKHLCSSISYGGANSLGELKEMFRKDPLRYLVKLSASSKKESYER